MTVRSRITPSVFTKSVVTKIMVVVVLFALLAVPALAPAARPDAASSSPFPHTVKFEPGETRFDNGDVITIDEVDGTAATFTPGNIYWIKGTYTLASRDEATLAAYVTAADSQDARSYSFDVQTRDCKRGSGKFTLLLPMSYRGWPHVSFYPAAGGQSFGGTYFGTGDSVRK